MKRLRVKDKPKKKTKREVHISKVLIYTGVVALILFLSIYFLIILSLKLADSTKVNGSNQYLLSQTKDDTNTTLVVLESGNDEAKKISEAYLFLTNKNKEESILIYIPGWIYYGGLEEDFGNSVAVSSFRYAGDFLQEGRGIEYSIWQIGQMLGIKVDNYIWFSPDSVKSYSSIYGDTSGVEDKLREYYKVSGEDALNDPFFKLSTMSSRYSVLKNMLGISKLIGLSKFGSSNLSFTEYLDFFANLNKTVSSTETYGIDLSFFRYSTEDLSSSGGQIRYINTTEFDNVYRGLIAKIIDRSLEKERVRVEIYNGSGVAGAAKQFGRKIENAGCDVVRYENAPTTIDRTVLYIADEVSFANSLKVVSEVLSGSYDLVKGRPDFMTTGDIVVVLGQDIKQMYSF
ncbi:MAG: hypothetical protein US14_C0012G0008 [candidate division WS6 bacterium GW2011_WS6_36_26]|uniref:LytR/CpsA/Psr regulator C-terminal domain-containing protein n=1 Tax=candidate division WS6 bacterium GW2011_GWF1_36_8 TaxID=1619098 RepID=A0A0G0FRL2_9BACT|nr:MAG: hypothetical protein US14_C0012G0008 [candidate division WS6 bacterium GW2011_WS6_36_26]KKQ16515.1 MAG: hypothetical protein US29_C0023G0002 [candidate division WS6 bacterium GW2011_GWF1_36_8]